MSTMDGFRHFFRMNNRTSPELGSHKDLDLGDRGQTKSPQEFRNPLEILENAGRKRGNKKTDRTSPTQNTSAADQGHLNDDSQAPERKTKGKGLKVQIQENHDRGSPNHDDRNPISHGDAGSPRVASTYPHSLFTRPFTPINSPSSINPSYTKDKHISDKESAIPNVPQVPEQHTRGGADKSVGANGNHGVSAKTAWPLQAKHLSEKKPQQASPTSDLDRRRPERIVIASPNGSTHSENSIDESARRGSHKGTGYSDRNQPRYSTMPRTSSRDALAKSSNPPRNDHSTKFNNNPRSRESVDAENAAALTVQAGKEEDLSLEEVPSEGPPGRGDRPTQQTKLPIGTAVSTPTTPTFTINSSSRQMKFPKPPKPPSVPTEPRHQARTRTFDSQRSATPSLANLHNRRNGTAKSGDSNAEKNALRNGGSNNNKMASVAEEERVEVGQADATMKEGADAPEHHQPEKKKTAQQQRQPHDDKDDGVVRVNNTNSVSSPILPQRRRIEEVQDEDEKRHGSGGSTPKGARSVGATSAVSRSRDRNDYQEQKQKQPQPQHHVQNHQPRNLSQSRSLSGYSQSSVHSGVGAKRGRGANKFSSAAWYGFVGDVAMSGKAPLVEV